MNILDDEIKLLINELGVKVVYRPMDSEAYYMSKFNIIVVNSKNSIFEQQKALLHELGHASIHQDNSVLYKKAYSLHSKMENEADQFMIKNILTNYLRLVDVEPKEVNYVNFLESNEIETRFEPFVRDLLADYIV